MWIVTDGSDVLCIVRLHSLFLQEDCEILILLKETDKAGWWYGSRNGITVSQSLCMRASVCRMRGKGKLRLIERATVSCAVVLVMNLVGSAVVRFRHNGYASQYVILQNCGVVNMCF